MTRRFEVTDMNPDDQERMDRREGCPSWAVTLRTTLYVRGRDAAHAEHVARESLLDTVKVPMDVDQGSEVRRDEEF